MNDWIAAQYRSGTSTHQIGKDLDLAHNAVCQHLRNRGIELAPQGRGRSKPKLREAAWRKRGIEDVAQFDVNVCQLYDAGHSMNQIRIAVGVSLWAIRSILTKSGRVIRSQAGREAQRKRKSKPS
jgi:hypothetical protein